MLFPNLTHEKCGWYDEGVVNWVFVEPTHCALHSEGTYPLLSPGAASQLSYKEFGGFDPVKIFRYSFPHPSRGTKLVQAVSISESNIGSIFHLNSDSLVFLNCASTVVARLF